MSVRRLADDAVQPDGFSFNRANSAAAKTWIKKYPKGREASAVIPLLMIAQEQDGWVTKASIEHIAEMLNMPYIRVLEVATFYTQFMLQPVGTKAHIQVCGTTPCMLRGSEALMQVCKNKINENQFETNSDGTLSWEEVECQGACVNAPMVMIFKDTYEDLTPARLEEIIDAFEAGKGRSIEPGPQNGRHFSAPIGGATTLLEDPNLKRTAATAKPKTAAKTATKAKAPKSKSAGPVRLKKPEGQADDLKLISGVGPKLEKTLNTLGFWHFSQIAAWKKADVAIVDDELSFKGRIERDEWIKQAKSLAKSKK
ncbi:MAG: NADH-quinone oxidoreductase subunit NuoE [Rhizobiaceae bacterium]|nr:NADH-quinone oxidoreductase subunit NuoE [Rhizobiaceae bacterium]